MMNVLLLLAAFSEYNFLLRCMECRQGLEMRILSIGPSVSPSVKCVDCDKTEERAVQVFIPYKR